MSHGLVHFSAKGEAYRGSFHRRSNSPQLIFFCIIAVSSKRFPSFSFLERILIRETPEILLWDTLCSKGPQDELQIVHCLRKKFCLYLLFQIKQQFLFLFFLQLRELCTDIMEYFSITSQ